MRWWWWWSGGWQGLLWHWCEPESQSVHVLAGEAAEEVAVRRGAACCVLDSKNLPPS